MATLSGHDLARGEVTCGGLVIALGEFAGARLEVAAKGHRG